MDIEGCKVRVYWNLHKNCFSVQDRKTGRVIKHTNYIRLKDVKFNVRKGGHQKVLQEKRKNVHAFVEGTVVRLLSCEFDDDDLLLVRYNPYVADYFFHDSGVGEWVISNSEECWLDTINSKTRIQIHREDLIVK